jgi:hypothetical protein
MPGHKTFEYLPILGMGEPPGCGVHRPPQHLVDFGVGHPMALPDDFHGPEAHDFAATVPQGVLDSSEVGTQPAVEPGLLVDLTSGGVDRAFTRLGFPLGKAPVVVAGTVHHGDPHLAEVADHLPHHTPESQYRIRLHGHQRSDRIAGRYPGACR